MTVALQDLTFLDSLFSAFFKRKAIKDTLAAIREDSIRGWEKWLQIELAVYLRKHKEVKAWGRETQYLLDKRVAKVRSKCAIDFIIHQTRKHSHLAVEIKQLNATKSCIDRMLRDMRKMNKIRGSEFDIRSVWCLGIHNATDADEVLRKVGYYAGELQVEIDPKLVVTRPIGRTGYSYTLF